MPPIYAFACQTCELDWDNAKRIEDRDELEPCPNCKAPAVRQITKANFNGAADWNCQTYNPALGCYTKSTKHARDIAKSRGLEEVGTTPPETLHKMYDKQRQEKRERVWADADREMQFD